MTIYYIFIYNTQGIRWEYLMVRWSFEKGAIDDFWRARRCFILGSLKGRRTFWRSSKLFFEQPQKDASDVFYGT